MFLYLLILTGILSCILAQQNPCYTNCKKGSCAANNPFMCEDCDIGNVLSGSKCVPVGGQSEPQTILPFLDSTKTLRNDFNLSNDQIVKCKFKSAESLTFADRTVSKTAIYTLAPLEIKLPEAHDYIIIKINAVMFNNNKDPSLKILIIDDEKKNIFEETVKPDANSSSLTCSRNGSENATSPAFYITIKLKSSSSLIFLEIETTKAGDELGVSNFLIFSGNCHLRCSTCNGPTQTHCLTCGGLLIKNTTSNQCDKCPTNYTLVEDFCFACPYQCKTCKFNANLGKPECVQCESTITNAQPPLCTFNGTVINSVNTLSFNETEDWKSSVVDTNFVTKCGVFSIIGGVPFGSGGSILSKSFNNLMAHKQIWIKFTILLIDQKPNFKYNLETRVDKQLFTNVIEIDQSLQNSNTCAGDTQEYVYRVYIPSIKHTDLSVSIEIEGQSAFFGIRDLVLGVKNLTSQEKCEIVEDDGKCSVCQNGFDIESNCEKCAEGQALTEDGYCAPCSIFCKTCQVTSRFNTENICSSCDYPLTFDQETSKCIDSNNKLYSSEISPHTNTTNKLWTFYPKLQDKGHTFCHIQNILGSTTLQYRSLSSKHIFKSLPPHQGVVIYFYFYQIDDYDGLFNKKTDYTVTFKINGKEFPYTVKKSGYNMCGNSSLDSKSKVFLRHPTQQEDLDFEIVANNVKFGISSFMVFLDSCPQCELQNGINQELELMPIYSIQSPSRKGFTSKIIFNHPVTVFADLQQIYEMEILNSDNSPLIQQNLDNNTDDFGRGNQIASKFDQASLKAQRELILFRRLNDHEVNKKLKANAVKPDRIFSEQKEDRIRSLRMLAIEQEFPRYDDIPDNDKEHSLSIRNQSNFLRGISILALFIGLFSFLLGFSFIFDDLFVLCQLIFVHVFINSAWLPATFKLTLASMNNVQFLAWFPIELRDLIESRIYDGMDYYQYSPIVFEQYWKDINFIRAIYHVAIFLAVMVIYFLLLKLLWLVVRPPFQVLAKQNLKVIKSFTKKHFFYQTDHIFIFMDRVYRFIFFTIVWAANLQFLNIQCLPQYFRVQNNVVCILVFIITIVFFIGGQIFLFYRKSLTNEHTFAQLYNGTRIKHDRIIYYSIQYIKLLVIAVLISQLHRSNPLAILIPLILIHLGDGLFIAFLNPYITDDGEGDRILSKVSKNFWFIYRISFIVQNGLFAILEIIMCIYSGMSRSAESRTYLNAGYAAVFFVFLLLINGMLRLILNIIKTFEVYLDDYHSQEEEIKSEEEQSPLAMMGDMKNGEEVDNVLSIQRSAVNIQKSGQIASNVDRRPSIEQRY